MSLVVRHAGQGAAYDFDGARFVMKASEIAKPSRK
jgi:hypothetical protein